MKTLRHAATLLGVVFLGAAAAGAVAGAATVLQIARRVIKPSARLPDTEVFAVDTGAQTIELSRTPDTELPGRYGLIFSGDAGYVKLGAVLSLTDSQVRRKLLTQIKAGTDVGRHAVFSGWYYSTPDELHLPYDAVEVGTPAGPAPAWLFPAKTTTRVSSTWVIQIHGRGVTRNECLRAVPVFHEVGLPVLVVSYRNDGEAPRTRGGAYALGASEWNDIDAAIDYALRNGAQQVVLMGWSMGGAIALQTVVSTRHRDAIAGVILESPVVEWRTVLRFQATEAGLRDPLPKLAMDALGTQWLSRLSGAEQAISFDQLDMVARADELAEPILILHSDDDGFVPSDASHALAQARPDVVTLHAFTGARHTKLWNYDQTRWNDAITRWLLAHELIDEIEPSPLQK